MVWAFWLRGTRSMRMSLMSRRIARVVSRTSPAKTNVQIGSAIENRGSSCTGDHRLTCTATFCQLPCLASSALAQLQNRAEGLLSGAPIDRLVASARCSRCVCGQGLRRGLQGLACFHQISAPAMATPMLCTKSPRTWMMAPLRLMLSPSPPWLCPFSSPWLCSCAWSPASRSCQHRGQLRQAPLTSSK